MNQEEVWMPIKSYNGKYEGSYEISNYGRVKSVERYVLQGGKQRIVKSKIKKQVLNTNGYPCVSLCIEKRSRLVAIHRLIAEAFIPNPDNKLCIDHINTNILDYRIENLQWVTHKENSNNPITKKKLYDNSHSKEAKEKSFLTKKIKGGKTAPKTVYQFSLEGVFVAEYNSIKEASKITGINSSDISSASLNKKCSAGGYLWSRTKDAPFYKPYSKKQKQIKQLSKDGELIKVWNSIKEASETLNITYSNISRCARGKTTRKLCGGFKWEYMKLNK